MHVFQWHEIDKTSQYCDTGDVGAVAARDTASWNKAVANSEVFCRSADEGMDARKLDAVSLLLFGSKTSQEGTRFLTQRQYKDKGNIIVKMDQLAAHMLLRGSVAG